MKYIEAMNVTCHIAALENTTTENPEMQLIVYEFAPFINTSDFCLTVNDNPTEVCSGSHTFAFSKIYPARKYWTLKMGMTGSSNYIPRVRFWVDLQG